jgi:hypothetical protein
MTAMTAMLSALAIFAALFATDASAAPAVHDAVRVKRPVVRAVPPPPASTTRFDGSWSVLIVTDSGSCDRAYRYGVQIRNGNVYYEGGVVNFQGRVASNGSVHVSVSAGSQRAEGQGRMSRDLGTGTWRGQGSTGTCAGTWEAERRG